MAIDRMSLNVGRGGFDPGKDAHVQKVIELAEQQQGPGWQFVMFDESAGLVHLERRQQVTSLSKSTSGKRSVKLLSLGKAFGPNDGEKAARAFEAMPDHEGYVMTRFDPYRGVAELTKLGPEEVRCRGAVANVLRVKDWEVQVRAVRGGGFNVELSPSYSPSKHDVALEEVATQVVGRPGWYLDIDIPKLQMRIVPAELPTFPGMIPYPQSVAEQFANDGGQLLFGQSLPATGDQQGEWLALDFSSGPHSTVNGTTGSGKTATINSLIRSAVTAGMELVIVDVPHKAVDYTWVKPYVREHGWGCESLEDAVVALRHVYEEGQRRGRVFKQYDVEKMAKLPADVRAKMPGIFIVVDELSGLLQMTDKLQGLPKDHPDRVAAEQENALHSMLLSVLLKIAAEMRAFGLYLLLSTQVANSTTGSPPKLRTLLSNKLLMGVNANKSNRQQTFNDPDGVPEIPDHIRVDKAAGRGVGAAEMEGQRPAVFKGVFADIKEHRKFIESLGRRRARCPEPSDELRRQHCSFLYEDVDGEPLPQLADTPPRFSGGPLPNDPDAGAVDAMGNPLRGAAAAAHASKRYANSASDPAPF